MGVVLKKFYKLTLILISFLLISSNFVFGEDVGNDPGENSEVPIINEEQLSIERDRKIAEVTEELRKEINRPEPVTDLSQSGSPEQSSSRSIRTDILDEALVGDFGSSAGSGYQLLKSNLPLIVKGSTTTNEGGGGDPTDWLRINLDTDEANDKVDNLTLTINSVTRSGGWTHHEVLILVHGPYGDPLVLLRADNFKHGGSGVMISHAFKTGTYYIGFYNTYAADSWFGSYTMSYNLTIEVESITQYDNNQIRSNADQIQGPLINQTLDMDTDLFDWFWIDSPDPTNYTTNFSITFEITDSAPVNYNPTVTPPIDFYTVVHIMILHEVSPGTFSGNNFMLNKQQKYDLKNKLVYNEYTNFERTYIGFYVQVIGRNRNDGSIGYQLGDNFMNGWVEYRIKKISALSVIPPKLQGGQVVEQVGKTYLNYIYNVTYFDANNDPPTLITLQINDSEPVPMEKRFENDNNYTDGVIYEYRIDGLLLGESYNHIFRFYAKDKENDALGDVNILHTGPWISNNIPPYIRDSAPTKLVFYEDCGARYWSPKKVFEDSDKDLLYYTLWNIENLEWSNKYNSENITITVLNNGSLKFKPKSNMYNRLYGSDTGSEIILINASDSRSYIDQPWEMEIIIISVNDAPRINRSFETMFYNSRLVIDEDTYYDEIDLTDIFHDPVENDPLTLSKTQTVNIDIVIHPSGMVNITPHENWNGAESVTFYASDGLAHVSDTLAVIVEPVNDAPILNLTKRQVAYEGQWYNYTFKGFDPADGDKLTFSTNIQKKLELTKDVYIFDKNTGELSFKASNKVVGLHEDINVSISDEDGGLDWQLLSFEIKNTPEPPVPKIISPKNNDIFLPWTKINFIATVDDPDLEIPDHEEEFVYLWETDRYGLISTSLEQMNQTLTSGNHLVKFEVTNGDFTINTTIEIKVLYIDNTDTDDDGIYDWWEIYYSLNPFDPRDANEDPDNDRFTNLEEFLGDDGKPATKQTDDDTDPSNRKSHPETGEDPDEGDVQDDRFEFLGNYGLFLISIIIIIFIISLLIVAFKKTKSDTEDEDTDDLSDKDSSDLESDNLRPIKEGLGLKIQSSRCHHCGESIDVINQTRPLVITCPSCDTRGVIY